MASNDFSAARVAEKMREWIDAGELDPAALFRFGVLQLLDDYTATYWQQGPADAAALFDEAPALTGDAGIDAALAGLADWLAGRDGFTAPAWVRDRRAPEPWFMLPDQAYREHARHSAPIAFRRHNVFIDERSLQRV